MAGIKDSSGDAERLLLEADALSDGVYTGSPVLVHLAGAIGCAGAILALANVDPRGLPAGVARRRRRAAHAHQRPPRQRARRHRRPQAHPLRTPRHLDRHPRGVSRREPYGSVEQERIEADGEAGAVGDPLHGEEHAGHEAGAVVGVVADREGLPRWCRAAPPGGRPSRAAAPSGSGCPPGPLAPRAALERVGAWWGRAPSRRTRPPSARPSRIAVPRRGVDLAGRGGAR